MKRILALLPLTAFVGCASLSSYQEARVLDKGKLRIAVGGTKSVDDLETVIDTASGLKKSGLDALLLEASVRVGVWEGLDIGLKTSIPGAYAGDVKYQFVGRDSASKFQLSSGLKVGYASLKGEDAEGEEVDGIPVIDLMLPVYATYEATSWMSITAAPQFTFRISDNELWYPGGAIAGGNVSLRLGKSAGLIGEFGFHRHLAENYNMMNYGAVLYAPFDASDLLSGLF